jgi:hypothetical protein
MDIDTTGPLADALKGFQSAKPLSLTVDGKPAAYAEIQEIGGTVNLNVSTAAKPTSDADMARLESAMGDLEGSNTPEGIWAELEAEPVPVVPRNRKPLK